MTIAVALHSTASPPEMAVALFPVAAVITCLRAELIETVKAEALIKGLPLPGLPEDIAKTGFQIDSLVVVSLLCAVEAIVGFELPESVVRAGGYGSVDSAIKHLLPSIEKLWMKRKGG